MYTTYAILDPTSSMFVYVGQTKDFDRRRRSHLAPHRAKRPPAAGSIKAWLAEAIARKIEPAFIVLEVVETEDESLLSETKWIEKLGREARHPLRNLWKEHKSLIRAQGRESYEALAFRGGRLTRIGRAEPNAKGTGLRLEIEARRAVTGPAIIELIRR